MATRSAKGPPLSLYRQLGLALLRPQLALRGSQGAAQLSEPSSLPEAPLSPISPPDAPALTSERRVTHHATHMDRGRLPCAPTRPEPTRRPAPFKGAAGPEEKVQPWRSLLLLLPGHGGLAEPSLIQQVQQMSWGSLLIDQSNKNSEVRKFGNYKSLKEKCKKKRNCHNSTTIHTLI